MKKYIKLFVISIGNLKNLKYHTSQEKWKKKFKEEESIEILKNLGLFKNK